MSLEVVFLVRKSYQEDCEEKTFPFKGEEKDLEQFIKNKEKELLAEYKFAEFFDSCIA